MNGLDIICSICLAELALTDKPLQALGCGHVFHKDWYNINIDTWLNEGANKCPICKKICSLNNKQLIYLSSQPSFEPIVNNLRVEFNEALLKSQRQIAESVEMHNDLFQEALLEKMERVYTGFNKERYQYQKAEKDWLASYSRHQTVIVVLSAYIVFVSVVTNYFIPWFLFFLLVEESILARKRMMCRQRNANS